MRACCRCLCMSTHKHTHTDVCVTFCFHKSLHVIEHVWFSDSSLRGSSVCVNGSACARLRKASFQTSENFSPSDLTSWQAHLRTLNIAFIFLCV